MCTFSDACHPYVVRAHDDSFLDDEDSVDHILSVGVDAHRQASKAKT